MSITALQNLLAAPVVAYEVARSLHYGAQLRTLLGLSRLLYGKKGLASSVTPDIEKQIQKEALTLFKEDAAEIVAGTYPLRVLKPDPFAEHMLQIPRVLLDAAQVGRRRSKSKVQEFSKATEELLSDAPKYYRRNYHFQTDGYFSEHSAQIYEHQVEILFSGAADAMRRLFLPALRKHFGKTSGKGLKFLEVGAGTGRVSRFVKLMYPRAQVVVSDLSDAYLKQAQKRFSDRRGVDFVRAGAEDLPFKDGYFDAVFSVFLFHEIPSEVRVQALSEAFRVMKSGGFYGMVDSIQLDDVPAYNPALLDFPKNYHEPFYGNYIRQDLAPKIEQAGFEDVQARRGFFSKALWAVKP